MALKSKIATFQAGLSQAIDAGVQETAVLVKDIRDPLTPVDQGDLKASGKVVQVGQGHWQFSEGEGLPDARAAYTEYGTARQAAQPHVTPAAEQARPKLAANVGARIKALEGKSKV
jgi:hypothetical protein